MKLNLFEKTGSGNNASKYLQIIQQIKPSLSTYASNIFIMNSLLLKQPPILAVANNTPDSPFAQRVAERERDVEIAFSYGGTPVENATGIRLEVLRQMEEERQTGEKTQLLKPRR